jgi:ParB-like chromosome segregation protein Spo0J
MAKTKPTTRSTKPTKGSPRALSDLTPDPHNRRKHNARNVHLLVDALQTVGAARSIVIDERGSVLAGNGVVEAAAEAVRIPGRE